METIPGILGKYRAPGKVTLGLSYRGSWAEVMGLKVEPDKENMRGKLARLRECGTAEGFKIPVRRKILGNWRRRAQLNMVFNSVSKE